MQIITKIKAYLNDQKEKRFWRFPDQFIAVIQLNDNVKVYAIVKNGLARLDRIPKPETGYSYLDIIEIQGPVAKEMFRDDEINVYKALNIIRNLIVRPLPLKQYYQTRGITFICFKHLRILNKKQNFHGLQLIIT